MAAPLESGKRNEHLKMGTLWDLLNKIKSHYSSSLLSYHAGHRPDDPEGGDEGAVRLSRQ